jgi:cytoskeletal protein CcmA (bactofilin family)
MITKKNEGPVQIGGMLGEGVRIEGTLEFNQTFRVDGEFKGKIQRSDRLVVGEKGRVSGEVEVNALVVYGAVDGKVRVKGALEVHPKGKISGELHLTSPTLTVHEGGFIEGRVTLDKRADGEVASLPKKAAQ